MKIQFHAPPLAKQKGGVENAIEGLRSALLRRGIGVDDATESNASQIHHFHGLWNPSHARVASQLFREKIPYVLSPHGMLEPWAYRHRSWKKKPYFHLIEKRTLRNAAAIFVTSELEARNLRKVVDHPRIEILPIGCRDISQPNYEGARESLGWNSESRTAVYLSRIDQKKGLDLLLRAFLNNPAMKDWTLRIIGDGDPDYLRKLKRIKNDTKQIIWEGAIWGEQRWAYLQAADLFCLTTHSENFGIAILEALHVGTPVLTTTTTPWADYREHKGFHICQPEVRSVRDELIAASGTCDDWTESSREDLSRWAVENFSWENLAALYERAYRRILANYS